MSNIYLENNRVMTIKEVDRYLKKIGTWREKISNAEIIALITLVLVVAGCSAWVCLYYKNHKNDRAPKIEQRVQESSKIVSNCLQTKFGHII